MTDTEQTFLDAAVGIHLPALELLEYIDGFGDVPTPELRDALEKAIARFETARSAVIDEAWANIDRQAGGGGE